MDAQRSEGVDDARARFAFGIVLARTNPDSVKHKGMTMFVIDMHAPGVEVRPLDAGDR